MALLTMQDYILFGVGGCLMLFWIILFFIGKKYADLFLVLDNKDYPLKDLYFVGYAAAELFHLSYKTAGDSETRKQLTVLYGAKYVDFYMRAIYAQRITMSLTIACLGLPLYCISGGEIILFLVMLVGAVAAFFYYGRTLPDKIRKRKEAMLMDFSEVISKLALLVSAGMVLRNAWKRVAASNDTEIYQEMQKSVLEMDNGISEEEAISRFGQQCMLSETKKFALTVTQGLSKGNSELASMLRQQSQEIWHARQQKARRLGEMATDKLLFPIVLVFIGILIMVIVPIFSGLGI